MGWRALLKDERGAGLQAGLEAGRRPGGLPHRVGEAGLV